MNLPSLNIGERHSESSLPMTGARSRSGLSPLGLPPPMRTTVFWMANELESKHSAAPRICGDLTYRRPDAHATQHEGTVIALGFSLPRVVSISNVLRCFATSPIPPLRPRLTWCSPLSFIRNRWLLPAANDAYRRTTGTGGLVHARHRVPDPIK